MAASKEKISSGVQWCSGAVTQTSVTNGRLAKAMDSGMRSTVATAKSRPALKPNMICMARGERPSRAKNSDVNADKMGDSVANATTATTPIIHSKNDKKKKQYVYF